MSKQLSETTLRFLSCESLKDLALFFGVTEGLLRAHLYGAKTRKYFEIQIPKKSGEKRFIQIPNGRIRQFQKILVPVFEELGFFENVCHGFRKGRSILTNAECHKNSRYIFSIDLRNFFPTIHFGRVRGLFLSAPFSFNPNVSKHLANLVCCDKKLPQGAPTSPILSNLICYRLDKDLRKFCKKLSVKYTRYADDLTFSIRIGELPDQLVEGAKPSGNLEGLILKHGFEINSTKVKLRSRQECQRVTGLVVNEKVNISRIYLRKIRGALNAWRKYGYDLANQKYKSTYNKSASRKVVSGKSLAVNLKGRIHYVGQVRGKEDGIYKRLLFKLFQLNPSLLSEKEIKHIIILEDKFSLLEKSVFVINNHSTSKQGTAFYLNGIGFVSCAHCLEPGAKLECPYTYKEHEIKNLKVSEVHDLAVFQVPTLEPKPYLFPGEKLPSLGSDIHCAGFPNYALGSTVHIVATKVASLRNISGIKYFFAEHGISPGKSGGPVIDEKNLVVGVCQKGGESGTTEKFQIFPIAQLKMVYQTMVDKLI